MFSNTRSALYIFAMIVISESHGPRTLSSVPAPYVKGLTADDTDPETPRAEVRRHDMGLSKVGPTQSVGGGAVEYTDCVSAEG